MDTRTSSSCSGPVDDLVADATAPRTRSPLLGPPRCQLARVIRWQADLHRRRARGGGEAARQPFSGSTASRRPCSVWRRHDVDHDAELHRTWDAISARSVTPSCVSFRGGQHQPRLRRPATVRLGSSESLAIAVHALWEGDRSRVGNHAAHYARLSARPARVVVPPGDLIDLAGDAQATGPRACPNSHTLRALLEWPT